MKVRDLIRALSTTDLDREIILSRDAEGNAFAHLAAVDGTLFYSARAGDVLDEEDGEAPAGLRATR